MNLRQADSGYIMYVCAGASLQHKRQEYVCSNSKGHYKN